MRGVHDVPPPRDKENNPYKRIMAHLKQRGAVWFAVWEQDGKKVVKTTAIPVAGEHGQTAKAAKKQAQMVAESISLRKGKR